MRDHAGNAGAGHLGRCRCCSHGRRDAVKDQQRCRQEAAAHAKQAGQDARKRPKRDDYQSVDGQVCNGEIDIHCPALSQRHSLLKLNRVKSPLKG